MINGEKIKNFALFFGGMFTQISPLLFPRAQIAILKLLVFVQD